MSIYIHIKSQKTYELLFEGCLESDYSQVAIYRSVDTGMVWVRPLLEFKQKFKLAAI